MTNPFTPTFGIVPKYLAGRQALITDLRKGFESGLGNPNLSTLLIGPRGSGKTALLSKIADEAQVCGWIAVNATASDNLLEDIYERVCDSSAASADFKTKRKLTGITIAQFLGLEWTNEKPAGNWRTRMTRLLKELEKHHLGLLIAVDEVHADTDVVAELASVYQLFIRDGFQVALVMAGLPVQIYKLLQNDRTSFLRRSRQHILSSISDTEIDRAFRKTVEDGGKKISQKALDLAVGASGGFAYMMQLVGYEIWEESGKRTQITEKDAEKGIKSAGREFRTGVLDSTYRELSQGDIRFLNAMLEDAEGSRIKDIANRLGRNTGYASNYKRRMVEAGIIEEKPGQTFVFSLPLFRQYLEELHRTNM